MRSFNDYLEKPQTALALTKLAEAALIAFPRDYNTLSLVATAMQEKLSRPSYTSLTTGLAVCSALVEEKRVVTQAALLAAHIAKECERQDIIGQPSQEKVQCVKWSALREWKRAIGKINHQQIRFAVAANGLAVPAFSETAVEIMVKENTPSLYWKDGIEAFRQASVVATGRGDEAAAVQAWACCFDRIPATEAFEQVKAATAAEEKAPERSLLKQVAQEKKIVAKDNIAKVAAAVYVSLFLG